MHAMRSWVTAGLVGVLGAAGCERAGAGAVPGEAARPDAVAPSASTAPLPAPPMSAADSAQARARIATEADRARTAFAGAQVLTAREIAELRQDHNALQIATARRLGLRVSGEADVERLHREGRLLPLGDSTAYWVLRDMEHSVPYVTPDARAMLEELGRRFHARLDRLGLPRYRMKVTSALRTDASQADLRRTNSYASRRESAHEFGTTVDVSHERFAVPAAGPGAGADPRMRDAEVEMLEEVGTEHARVLQAELGRSIAEMRDEGGLQVMMENQQPVYHMTVARHFPATGGPPRPPG